MKADSEVIERRIDALTQFYHTQMRMPTFAEMCGLFGVRSKNAVAKIVTQLEARGCLRRDRGHLIPLSIAQGTGLRGYVAAGFPSPAEEELLDVVTLDDLLIKNRASCFRLKVSGDSMIEAGIMPGDMVIVDKSLTAHTGDIVVARLDGEATLKYYCVDKAGPYLQPANARYPAMRPQRELKILGVVVSVVRKLR